MKFKLIRLLVMSSIYTFIGVFLQCILLNSLLASELSAQRYQSIRHVFVDINTQNTTLEGTLRAIETQTEFNFVYELRDLEKGMMLNTKPGKQSVAELLVEISRQAGLKFRQINNNINVQKLNKRLPTRKAVQAIEQEVLVKGAVKDENGEPLPGVSILVKGTSTGTTTDMDGNFSISVPESSTLLFSFIGYEAQEIALNGQTALEVVMATSSTELDEIVVVGYGTQKKANLSGAVDVVSADAIVNRPVTSTGAALQGMIPNLNISISSGQATEAPEFNIRGFTSINGGGPLILVDNIPVSNEEVARINPNDIESVSVLKDAASAAIYGARGAFGVVLITTKSGTSDKLTVSANANYAVRTLGKTPDVVTDPYMAMKYKHDAAFPLYNLYPESVREYAKQRSEDPSLPAAIPNPNNPDAWQYYGSTNWLDEVYNKSAASYNANFSIGKKDEKMNYYLSSDYFKQEGMFRYGNDIYNRYNLRGKVALQVTDWLQLGNNTVFTHSDYEEPSYNNGESFFHEVNRKNSLDIPKNPDGTRTNTGASMLGRLQEGGRADTKLNEIQTSFNMEVALIKDTWLLKGDATFRRSNETYKRYEIPVAYRTGPNQPLQYIGANTKAVNSSEEVQYNVYNVYTDFHKTFGGKHFVQAVVGYNQEYRTESYSYVSRDKLITSSLPSLGLASGAFNGGETIEDWAVRGAFYRLNYVFDDRYIFEFNGRYDGSSRFPKDDRFGFFPSASAAWVVSKEAFFQSIGEAIKMDFFKLRASYGSLGNQDVDAYEYIMMMTPGRIGPVLGGERPVYVSTPGLVSPSLTWEKVSTVNFGADLSFFKNKLDLGFDLYTRYNEGMLTKGKTLPNVIGTLEPNENAADLKTNGWELKVTWRDDFMLANSPFRYGVTVALADSRAYITKIDNPNKLLSGYYEGQELGEIWGLETEGFFQSKEELENHADQTAVGSDDQGYRFDVGDLKFKDQNGDGKIDRGDGTVDNPGDFKVIGNSRERLPFSVNLTAEWKGFDLRAFVQGVGKRDWYPEASNHYFWGIYAQPWTNVQAHNLDHWTPDNPNGYFPRVKSYIAEDESELGIPQTRYLQNAAYLRMKNITLGYTLPSQLMSKIGIERLRVYVSAENVFEISSLKAKLDPESIQKSRARVYPFQRTVSMGVNLNF
ncbi:TonB-dependent receptor [Rapidithrix thailandica]|uniref:TonB-dependent receptor n=1 Tax=Rapidithrix thailandica TaxID=413964 RepID=A0AAW9S5E4_9BACT